MIWAQFLAALLFGLGHLIFLVSVAGWGVYGITVAIGVTHLVVQSLLKPGGVQ